MHVCIAFLSIFSMLDSSSLLSDGDFDVVSKLSSAALARTDIKAFAKSKHNAMFLFLSIRLQFVFLTSIYHINLEVSNFEYLFLFFNCTWLKRTITNIQNSKFGKSYHVK